MNKKGDLKASVVKRIMRLISFTGLITLLTVFALYFIMYLSYREISESEKQEFGKEAQALLTVTTTLPDQIVWDYTYWDELVSGIRTNDSDFYSENISTIPSSFHLDYACVLDSALNKRHEVFSEEVEPENLLPENILDLFSKGPSVKFFVKTPKGFYKISGASVHPTNDPNHNLYKPTGYLFIGMHLGDDYQQQLSTLSGGEVLIKDTSYCVSKTNKHHMTTYIDLEGQNGESIGHLILSKNSDALRMMYNGLMLTIILFLVAGLVIWMTIRRFLVKWVVSPLTDINLMLADEDPVIIEKLMNSTKEYSNIATLFKMHLEQKEELVRSKIKAEESSRLKTSFLANISHEIRTPVNGILGFSELLKLPENTEEQKAKYLGIIEDNGKRMVKLLNDLIKKSQLDSGQVSPSYSQFNLNEMLDFTFVHFRPEAKRKNLELIVEKKFDTSDVTVTSDREMVYFIIISLIKNSILLTNEGKIIFGIDKTDRDLLFYVKDTGIGIAENKKESVFDVFVKAETTCFTENEGVGLGLPISKAYAELLGGKLWVESTEGEGSSFYFLIKNRSFAIKDILI